MLKRTCDRCGAEIDHEWFKIETHRHTDTLYLSVDVLRTDAPDIALASTPDYCSSCIEDIKQYASKRIPKEV